jgi:hypothetical protein
VSNVIVDERIPGATRRRPRSRPDLGQVGHRLDPDEVTTPATFGRLPAKTSTAWRG